MEGLGGWGCWRWASEKIGSQLKKLNGGWVRDPKFPIFPAFYFFFFLIFIMQRLVFLSPGLCGAKRAAPAFVGKNLVPSLASASAANSYWHV